MKRVLQLVFICLLIPLASMAKEWDETLYKQIEQSIKMPQINGKDYDITKFGAKVLIIICNCARARGKWAVFFDFLILFQF